MNVMWKRTFRTGEKWSGVIQKGNLLRFTALKAGANLAVLLYNQRDLTERYNMPDTLKAQHTAHLTKGNVLMSDNGRVLASIVEDSLGWHDTISGITTKEMMDSQYGKTEYQELRNEYLKNAYDNFAIELVRNGLGLRDLVPPVNLFSKIQCDQNGDMKYIENHCKKGDTVTLRLEMDVMMLLSNTPNPLYIGTEYPEVPILLEVIEAKEVDFLDECVNYRPENRRAFENTWEYYTLMK